MDNYECGACYWRLCGCGECCLQRGNEGFCEHFTPEDEYADVEASIEEGRKEYRVAWWEYIAQFE